MTVIYSSLTTCFINLECASIFCSVMYNSITDTTYTYMTSTAVT